MTSLRRFGRFSFALVALFVVVAAIAALCYAISAWQVFGFARYVWKLPVVLCFAAAVVADLLSLSGLFATYLLREAKRKVRAYAWCVFLLMTGLSIAAAEGFAAYRDADMRSQVAAGAIVVALALAVHLLIISVRHAKPAPGQSADALTVAEPATPRREHTSTAERAAGAAPVRERPTRPIAPPSPPPPSSGKRPEQPKRSGIRGRQIDPAEQNRRDLVAAMVVAKGGDRRVKQAAADAGNVSTRTIELWVASWKERGQPVPVDPDEPAETQPPVVETQPANPGNPQLKEEVTAHATA